MTQVLYVISGIIVALLAYGAVAAWRYCQRNRPGLPGYWRIWRRGILATWALGLAAITVPDPPQPTTMIEFLLFATIGAATIVVLADYRPRELY